MHRVPIIWALPKNCVRSYAQAMGRIPSDDQNDSVVSNDDQNYLDENQVETVAATSASEPHPVKSFNNPGSANAQADISASQEAGGTDPAERGDETRKPGSTHP